MILYTATHYMSMLGRIIQPESHSHPRVHVLWICIPGVYGLSFISFLYTTPIRFRVFLFLICIYCVYHMVSDELQCLSDTLSI
jgi:hypothetical protein